MKNLILICCVSLTLLISCGKNKDGSSTVLIKPPLSTNPNFQQAVDSAVYYCGEASCPLNTVAVAVNNIDNVAPTWCTGTVLKNGKVLTSKSCFSEYFFDTNNPCSEKVLIKTFKGQVMSCADFISVSPSLSESYRDPASRVSDFVILSVPQLVKANIAPANINFNAIKAGSIVSLWHLNQLDSLGIELSLEVAKCINQNGSLISPWGKSGITSHVMLSRCQLPHSAVGSAILNSDNQIQGIIHTVSKEEDLTIWDHRVLDGQVLQHYALGNNFDCTSLLSDKPEYCEQKNYTDSKLNTLRNEMFTHFDDLNSWKEKLENYAQAEQYKYLKWSASLRFFNDKLLYEVDFIPTCFPNSEKWINEFRGGLLNMFYNKEAYVYKTWPYYEIYSGLDQDFMLQTDLFDAGERLYQIKFSPKGIKKKGKSDVAIFDQKAQQNIVELKDVPVCQ